MLFSKTLEFTMSTHEGKRSLPPTYVLRRRRRRLERHADCEGIKFVTGELRREWHTEERDFYAAGRKNNYRARLIDRPEYCLLFLFLTNIAEFITN